MEKWIKDITRNNRTFRLTFYEEPLCNGMWHCIVEEIYRKKKNIFDLSWKDEIVRFCTTNKNVLKQAFERIDFVFKSERDRGYTIKELNNFVGGDVQDEED
ncbi:MAG: hypothetical protein IJH63_15335 [Methanobrevibacter sp.]|nr:hypothetical protein [Methanobrevibacter sp.]